MDKSDATTRTDPLREQYRALILSYFQTNPDKAVEDFVSELYKANLPVSELIAMHGELMEDLGRQLKLEGRNPSILLDYRITLIDVISHLCERYRRRLGE